MTRVVDDTVRVLIEGQDTAVRLIGIDTPETVAPNRPVDCAGPEASVYAEQLMSGEDVFLDSTRAKAPTTTTTGSSPTCGSRTT